MPRAGRAGSPADGRGELQLAPSSLWNCATCGAPLVSAADSVALRATPPQSIAAALLQTYLLSPRERATFELLGLGYDNRALSQELQVSERTAKRHVTAILAKLGLESRLQAGLVALITFSWHPTMPEDRMNTSGNSR